jgi:sugar/nucleoside kinase (ribokinase family)
VILVDARTGERHVLWHRDARLQAAWTGRPDDLTELAASGRLLLVDADNVAASALAAAAARRAGIPTLVDVDEVGPGVDELLRDIDVIVVAEPFPGELTGQPDLGRALEALEREYHAALVVVTLGAQGSLARCGGREIRTAAYPVGCVDSTGAGDVFRGALAAAMLRDSTGSVEAALEFANAAAALNCRGLGASGGLPTLPEVDRLVSSRSDQV